MSCNFNCLIGYGLIGSMLATSFVPKNTGVFQRFNDSLNKKQKYIYSSIVNERFSIFSKAVLFGTILGLFTMFIFKKKNKLLNGCKLAIVSISAIYILYNIHPKSDYMLNHLTSTEQNKLWLETYKEMKMRSHLGIVMGIIGYLVIGCSL